MLTVSRRAEDRGARLTMLFTRLCVALSLAGSVQSMPLPEDATSAARTVTMSKGSAARALVENEGNPASGRKLSEKDTDDAENDESKVVEGEVVVEDEAEDDDRSEQGNKTTDDDGSAGDGYEDNDSD